jgi:hypothetical protein
MWFGTWPGLARGCFRTRDDFYIVSAECTGAIFLTIGDVIVTIAKT